VKKEESEMQTMRTEQRPDPEVDAMPKRRRFTAKYKLRVLQEVDKAREAGQIGSVLRREGLFSSHLTTWRAQRDSGALTALGQKRGRKAKPLDLEKEQLQKENARLRREVQQLRAINEIQKKVSELLGIPQETPESDGNG